MSLHIMKTIFQSCNFFCFGLRFWRLTQLKAQSWRLRHRKSSAGSAARTAKRLHGWKQGNGETVLKKLGIRWNQMINLNQSCWIYRLVAVDLNYIIKLVVFHDHYQNYALDIAIYI